MMQALVHLNILSQQLTAFGNSSPVESTNDATTALTSGDANKALFCQLLGKKY